MGTKAYVIAMGISLAVVITAVFILTGQLTARSSKAFGNATEVASSARPTLLLILLKGAEDSSQEAASYEPDNSETITLKTNDHVRFQSPDNRMSDSMKAIAKDKSSGSIFILRKSYDVNNEFFVNLDKGEYQLRVQASWFDKGTHVYLYNVSIA